MAAAEARLLDLQVRRDPVLLARLLAPNFREIGQSGRLWDREEIIAQLCSEPGRPPATPWPMNAKHVEALADGLFLLTYALELAENGRCDLRSGALARTGRGWSSTGEAPYPGNGAASPEPTGTAEVGRPWVDPGGNLVQS
ncbi:DUF4440 domain-containing protein [Paeniglutamicibacter kerguelensis]|uniref:DUF4440 domain-containing protein n=1 Tax=Paeniglutamicibacter kerguelensis TaxID=254788 RepID=A0ABS4XAL5_9MICC|nr:hypothetical protein [Paeniglutamicibacter kerguelensis]